MATMKPPTKPQPKTDPKRPEAIVAFESIYEAVADLNDTAKARTLRAVAEAFGLDLKKDEQY